ncbi:MAG: response regulator, partial [Candidatus Lokiarchaeota archaeon]|nr:response regulator [Candidatus Lokiarchaeota archaeon]
MIEEETRAAVLVVDDNPMNRDLLARQIEQHGHTVAMAENGLQALDMLQTQDFDLVLLDVMMPGMNGSQVLEKLKAHPDFSHIPVIMISALNDLEITARCIELGAEDYLLKPFNRILLRARINAALQKKR